MKNLGRVYILDDDELIASMLSRHLKKEGYEVRYETSPAEAVGKIIQWATQIVLLDVNMPGKSGIEVLTELKSEGGGPEVVMLTADDTAETAVKAIKLGASDYLTKPLDLEEVKLVVRNIMEKARLKREVDYHRKVNSELIERKMLGESTPMRELKEKAEKIAAAGISTVLITGESGSGKELMARYIHSLLHDHGDPEAVPFIGVNCAALPDTLLESELFGHEKGSFTDARTSKKGVFELAEGGTLLLDEIGEMKTSLQSKLLRVLEERTFRRIGGKEDIPTDATVIVTTNRDLSQAVEKSDFRLDLFYRLNAFSLTMPPLRERKDDIISIANHYLGLFAVRYKKLPPRRLSPEAEDCLRKYGWPGNVRELRNVIERIVVLENAEVITPSHLPPEIAGCTAAQKAVPGERFVLPDSGFSLDDFERDMIVQALEKAGQNKTLAAKLLNISYDSLRYQVKKFGLE